MVERSTAVLADVEAGRHPDLDRGFFEGEGEVAVVVVAHGDILQILQVRLDPFLVIIQCCLRNVSATKCIGIAHHSHSDSPRSGRAFHPPSHAPLAAARPVSKHSQPHSDTDVPPSLTLVFDPCRVADCI